MRIGAREHFARAVEGFRTLALPWGLGNSLTGMATVVLAAGDPAQAERLLDEATSVLRQAAPWFLSWTLYLHAFLAVQRGDAQEAIALVRESLTQSSNSTTSSRSSMRWSRSPPRRC